MTDILSQTDSEEDDDVFMGLITKYEMEKHLKVRRLYTDEHLKIIRDLRPKQPLNTDQLDYYTNLFKRVSLERNSAQCPTNKPEPKRKRSPYLSVSVYPRLYSEMNCNLSLSDDSLENATKTPNTNETPSDFLTEAVEILDISDTKSDTSGDQKYFDSVGNLVDDSVFDNKSNSEFLNESRKADQPLVIISRDHDESDGQIDRNCSSDLILNHEFSDQVFDFSLEKSDLLANQESEPNEKVLSESDCIQISCEPQDFSLEKNNSFVDPTSESEEKEEKLNISFESDLFRVSDKIVDLSAVSETENTPESTLDYDYYRKIYEKSTQRMKLLQDQIEALDRQIPTKSTKLKRDIDEIKTPQKSVQKQKIQTPTSNRTYKYKHIESPISRYIHENPVPLLKQTVRPRTLTTVASTAFCPQATPPTFLTPTSKPMKKFSPIPIKSYTPAKTTKIIKIPNENKLPKSAEKCVPIPRRPLITKHVGRVNKMGGVLVQRDNLIDSNIESSFQVLGDVDASTEVSIVVCSELILKKK